ncbi:MAG: class I SAM-dependent methyltransferase [Actinomycetota bacterium]|nr:class I SAM-dependent methyltransferase [Actinomycetota bacterium]
MSVQLEDEWGASDYELVFEVFTGMPALHRHLVERLAPKQGERWLDLATGTGRVARLAARAGAAVTAQDSAPGMIDSARRLTDDERLSVDFDVCLCESLPYADASYDVVSSAVGAIFAPDHHSVAIEVGRVCRSGGRLGLVAWRPDEEFAAIFAPFADSPAGDGDPSDWGREQYVQDLLGSDFQLEFEEGDAPITGTSGAAIWDVWLRSVGPTRRLFESLDQPRQKELEQAFVAYFERFRTSVGIHQHNPYLLVLGTRRRGRDDGRRSCCMRTCSTTSVA